VKKSLVAFDTDHIKNYVFGTDRLKENRGASALLDRLNRQEMAKIARRYGIEKDDIIYEHGGSGLFVVDSKSADEFGQEVQKKYRELTGGGASITYVVQPLPAEALQGDRNDLLKHDLSKTHTLDVMRYKLRAAKDAPVSIQALSSHPFMRPCDACGVSYAEEEDRDEEDGDTFYCKSCFYKMKEDRAFIGQINRKSDGKEQFLWHRIISRLKEEGYEFGGFGKVNRPKDFNEFRQFAENSKEYIGLIYADANNMGALLDELATLQTLKNFAGEVDEAVISAMSRAIKMHLPVVEIERQERKKGKALVPVFPFDILLVGGDDIVMVTSAAKAMDVALAIATEFRELTDENKLIREATETVFSKLVAENRPLREITTPRLSLCVGVVLAPIKYPFGLLQDMAESSLKFAKKTSANAREKVKDQKELAAFDGTRINFQVVTGGSHPNFNETYKKIYLHKDKDRKLEFHASLRAYKPEDLALLLQAIREGHTLKLGRTKLHQLREAILEKNLTTAVQMGLATLRNWQDKQRAFVVESVYEFGGRYRMPHSDPNNPVSGFPRVTFPWFADGNHHGRSVYRTSLLDFVELYDFVTGEGGEQ
jgi:CRISPR/Cas system-associated protein Cas10 (large subunit of type III CRISPR-Cas system)